MQYISEMEKNISQMHLFFALVVRFSKIYFSYFINGNCIIFCTKSPSHETGGTCHLRTLNPYCKHYINKLKCYGPF